MAMLYFHRSSTRLQIGQVLTGRGLPKNPVRLEDAFEGGRPADLISRREAVFMADAPIGGLHGVSGGFVYIVEPALPVLRLDNRWVGKLQQALLAEKYDGREGLRAYPKWTPTFVDDCVRSYWSGAASSEPSWEYISRQARVVQLVTSGAPGGGGIG
jgi:hypothetical protein